MAKGLLLVGVLLAIEALTVLAFTGDRRLLQVAATERQAVRDWLGEGAEAALAQHARDRFNRWWVHTGVLAASYQAVIPDAAARHRSGRLAAVGSESVFPWLQRRLDAQWDSLRQVHYRLAWITWWLPWLAPLALAALVDGGLQRRIKWREFGNLSPARHRYGLYGLLALLALLLLSLGLPRALAPGWLPALLIGAVLCLRGVLANTQRRL